MKASSRAASAVSPGKSMNSQRWRPGPDRTQVVGRAGSQICRLISGTREAGSTLASITSQGSSKP